MALHLHRGERSDRLVAGLAGILSSPLADPVQSEVVSVPTRGMERWVAQQLSATLGAGPGGSDGVCANVAFPFPARLIERALLAQPADDRARWRPERMVWPLLDAVEAAAGEAWLAPLAGQLAGQGGDGRLGALRRLADMFDRYAIHRPDMVGAWATGRDLDGSGEALPARLAWQPELWRRVRERIGVACPAELIDASCAAVAEDPGAVDLPDRLSVFGVTRLPATYLQVLRTLAGARDVHLFVLHPSPALWRALEGHARPGPQQRRSEDRSIDEVANPLLASWGRDARELQLTLAAGGDAVDHHHPLDVTGTTLLSRLQDSIRRNQPAEATGTPVDPGDRSVSVHACHGKGRQVEVLHDAILHALGEDPTLQPRDVIVMCPDIEAFAPLIGATFGAAAALDPGTGGRVDLRTRLADRSLRQTNPVLGVVAGLLELASARVTASEVLDLAGRGPVRTRFAFDDEDVDRIETWVETAAIRWGLDGAHRTPFDLPALEGNTWASGLARILLGAAMSEDDLPLVGGVLPLDDVDSSSMDLAGRLAELVARLAHALDRLRAPARLTEWAAAVTAAAGDLCAVAEADTWQTAELAALLDDLTTEAAGGDPDRLLTLPEVRALLADRLRGRPTRANFRTGHLTVCTLVPMRSVPHRVVCLLGIDDGAFPRRADPSGDDLVDREPCVGDRDPRSEDRQLWLDAVLAASDRLIVTYQGRDPRTNARCPPAVPLGELLDALDVLAGSPAAGGAPARDRLVVHHPLQPFDTRNYTAGACGLPGPWSHEPVNLAGARALAGPRRPATGFLDRPLPDRPPGTVELEDLARFLRHPVQAFLRQRLVVGRPTSADETADTVPIELDALAGWAVGDRLLRARLAGIPLDVARQAERARGTLPPAALGERVLDQLIPPVESLVATAHRLGVAGPGGRDADVVVALPGGWSVSGTVGDLHRGVIGRVGFSRVRSRARLEGWVHLLALSAARPEVPWTAVVLGRDRSGAGVVALGPVGTDADRAATAGVLLERIVDLYRRGMTEPLPLYCETSRAWAVARRRRKDPERAAAAEWETAPDRYDKEDRDPDHLQVHGGVLPLEQLLALAPSPGEDGPGWEAGEESRLGRLARRLWDPILDHEAVISP